MENISLPLIVTWFLTIGTALVGIWQFTRQHDQANKRPFLEHQLTTCIEAADAASRLATETDPQNWEEHWIVFLRLYWGRLAIVEDREVESRMAEIYDVVRACRAKNEIPPFGDLELPALRLAHALRELVLASWGVKLARLQAQDTERISQDTERI